MNRELPILVFIVAMISIFVVSMGGLAKLYWILYPNSGTSDWELKGPVSSIPKSFNLEIANPEDELLSFEKSVVVSGKTSPRSTILIATGERSVGLESNAAGDFSKIVELTPGINQIIIAAFDNQGSSRSATRTVYFEEEKL